MDFILAECRNIVTTTFTAYRVLHIQSKSKEMFRLTKQLFVEHPVSNWEQFGGCFKPLFTTNAFSKVSPIAFILPMQMCTPHIIFSLDEDIFNRESRVKAK